MRNSKSMTRPVLATLGLGLLFFPPVVFAYLDPTTGSMVVSAIVGIIASIALAVKTYWYKIKGFFKRDNKTDSTSEETPD